MQGLLLLDKPEGITSFGAVSRIKRLSGEKRVGHTGTLDPMATGALPIFLGRATALSSFLLEADKQYTAKVKLGLETDSCDITGKVISRSEAAADDELLRKKLLGFTGDIRQQPPMFSALKKDGIRLYELARRGEEIDIPYREVTVHSLELLRGIDEERVFEMAARVSKGTYIRSLARDIGRELGCGATLTALRRTATAGFSVDECVPLDKLTEDNLSKYIVSEELAVKHFRAVYITEKQAGRFLNGGALALDRISVKEPQPEELFRVKYGKHLLGLGKYDAARSCLSVKCLLILPEALCSLQEG